MKLEIGIFSRNRSLYSTQSIANAARRRGHRVEVIDHLKCNLILEENRFEVDYEGFKLRYFDAIIPRIGSTVTTYGAAIIRHFERMGVTTMVSADALLRARDKFHCLQLLASNGIKIPRTLQTSFMFYDHTVVLKELDAPLVIKLLEGTHGLGVILSETQKNAESVVEAFNRLEEKILLQEFIAEANGTDIRAFVVGGRVVASMQRISKPGEFRSNLHRGATAKKIQLQPEEEEAAIKATHVLGLDSAGVDILRSHRGPLILEVNASPGLEGIEGATGINVATEIVLHLENKYRNQKNPLPL
jgi:ribosomal protein S6--L-glutamate ligase